MDNQEYKAKLESFLERAKIVVKELRKDIDEADKNLEAEKPKRRHGDFGIDKVTKESFSAKRNR